MAEHGTVEIPVRFSVSNVNRSSFPCLSDGRTYVVAGRLIAPDAALSLPERAVTLYLHEFGWGRFFFDFPDANYGYAVKQALAGHVSVVVDRLGYGDSSKPPGFGTCLGSQADVAHQLVEQLRSGTYETSRGNAIEFDRVTLAGHSAGGLIAEIAAYSFGGIDALILFAYADQGFTQRSVQEANEQVLACLIGGEGASSERPGYAYFAQTAEEWKTFMFASAEERVADQAAAMRSPDPCGDVVLLTPAVMNSHLRVREISVPVLLLYGTSDAIYEQPMAGQDQRRLFSGSDDVTLRFFDGTGHAMTLERSAPEMRRVVSEWLANRDL